MPPAKRSATPPVPAEDVRTVVPSQEWSLESAIAKLPPGFLPAPKRSSTIIPPQDPATTSNGTLPTTSSKTTPITFFHLISLLKLVKREGWRRFGIAEGESVAEHMYRMSIMTIAAPPALAQSGVDPQRATRMALVHDMAESLVGDITPVDRIPAEEKARRERTVITYIAEELLGGASGAVGEEIRELWEEYEANETPTAKWVKDIDKIELLLQTIEYEKKYGGNLNLGEFTRVASRLQTSVGKEWAVEILRERESFWKETGEAEVLLTPEAAHVTEQGEIGLNTDAKET